MTGSIWFLRESTHKSIGRLAVDLEHERLVADGALYPSAVVVPGGELVAIASRGDGSADGEQIALVDMDGERRIGPRGAQVRDPTLVGDSLVVAATVDGHSELVRIPLAQPDKWRRITRNPEGNFAPAALAGTRDVVFSSSRDGNAEIYRVATSGKRTRRLTAFHKDDWAPVPAPDGKTVAFLSDREGRARIFLMAPDGTNQRRLTTRTDEHEESNPTWSPDGRSIAYVVADHVWLRDVARGTERDLTPDGSRDGEPGFSPDGAWIALARERDRDVDLWAVPTAAGGAAVRLTDAAGVERLPRWVP